MPGFVRSLALTLLGLATAACTDTAAEMQPPALTVIRYPMSDLPMSERTRVETAVDLSMLASPAAIRACPAPETEFLELSLLLKRVEYEKFRTEPWSAGEAAEVEALRRRWHALGGASRPLSASCQKFAARLGALF